VGVAVPSLEPTTELLKALFGYRVVSGPFDDPVHKVTVSFLATGVHDVPQIELIAPLGEDSPINLMLTREGVTAYHLCFETTDIVGALAHAKKNGCVIVSAPKPAVAFQGRRVAWIYTQSNQLFEFLEADPDLSRVEKAQL